MAKKPRNIEITKLTGAGNDFLLIDTRKNQIQKKYRVKLVRSICDRHFGLGADGVVFLEKDKDQSFSFSWDFYNQDGSFAEMCLNAARCAVEYESLKSRKKKISFRTRAGKVSGEKKEKNIWIKTNPPAFVKKEKIKINGRTIEGCFVNSGVPHFVIRTDKINEQKFFKEASLVRKNKKFPQGTNVTYWQKTKGDLLATTYERGVEGFTLACGTGALAVFLVQEFLFGTKKQNIKMPGGLLRVVKRDKSLFVGGPAKVIYKTRIHLGEFL